MEKIQKGDAVVIMRGAHHGSGVVLKSKQTKALVHTTEDTKEWYDKKDLDAIKGSVWETRIRETIKEQEGKKKSESEAYA